MGFLAWDKRTGVSIHAPLRGATIPVPGSSPILSSFNPRTPAGCDERMGAAGRMAFGVSIHAPLRGATDIATTPTDSFNGVSIHAPLRGATLTTNHVTLVPAGFNPRTPAGCDAPVADQLVLHSGVSIHAPLRGATRSRRIVLPLLRSFNPRTPAGCDFASAYSRIRSKSFQSTHPCGVRPPVYTPNHT